MSYLSVLLSDGPTSVWMLDEASGATAADSSGNSHDATYSAINTYRVAGPSSRIPSGIKLVSGSSSHVQLPAAGIAVDAVNGFSVSCWAYIDSFANWARVCDLGNGASTNNLVIVPQDDTSKTGGLVFNGGSSARSTGTRMTSGAWHHLCWTVTASGGQVFYLDGVQLATGSGQAPAVGTRGSAYLGRSDFSDPYLNGRLAAFAVFPKVLSAARAKLHYLVGSGQSTYQATASALNPIAYWRLDETSGVSAADASGNGHTGTYVGTPTLNASGLIGTDPTDGAVTLAAGKYVSSPVSAAYDIAHPAIVAWVKGTSFANLQTIASQSDGTGSSHWSLTFDAVGRVVFDVISGGDHTATGSVAVNDGSPHMVVGRYDGNFIDVFVDAVRVAHVSYSGGMNVGSGIPLTIGATSTGATTGSLTVDEVLYLDAANLSDTQIQTLYLAALAGRLAGASAGVSTSSGSLGVAAHWGTSAGIGAATGSITVTLPLRATGSRIRGGSAVLAATALIEPPAGTVGQGWEANGRVRGGYAVIDLDPDDPPDPPSLHRVHLKTLTNTYDPPTIVGGQPYNADGSPWKPLDGEGTHGDWGYYRVIIDGRNRTLVRGFPTLVVSYSDEDPGGPVTLTVAFPGITSYDELDHGDLVGIRSDAKIRVEHRKPDGTWADDAFDGEMGIESDSLTDATGGTSPASYVTFTCRGWWEVLDDFITLPRANPDPIEAAQFIEGHAHRARQFGWPAHMAASGITGLKIAERGEYGASMQSQTIVNALKLMQRLDGTVYTVAWTGRSRLQIVERSWGGAPDFSLYVGQRGVSHTLTRDPEQAKTAIYGRGQAGNQAWENWQYPSAYVNPPAYPLPVGFVCGVNLFCPGSGATGFQVFSDELRAHYDVDLASQDTYLAGDEDVIYDFQGKLGVQQDGVVGPQTWNQTFQLGQNADVLADAYIRELWSVVATQPWILNARGGIVGRNPAFDPNEWRRRETLVDFGVLAKSTARTSARLEGQRSRLPYYVGTIVARNVDPVEMPALDTRSGMNMQFLGHRGVDRDLHVVRRDVVTGMAVGGGANDRVVTWTVSEKPDDMMTLAQILARKQGVRDLVKSNRPHRRSAHRTPDWVPFDSESGAGLQTPVAQFAGLWNVLWVPMGEAVDVDAVKLVASTPCLIAAAMFNQKITPNHLTSLPGLANPSVGTGDPWQDNADALDAIGIQWATGGPSAMQGYWPHAPGGSVTGVLADTSPWPFRTLRPPWGYLAVWTSASCRISGDPSLGYRAIFPAPEH